MIWTFTISLWIVHQSDILPRFIIDGYCGTVCAHDSGYSSGNDNHLRTNHVPQFMHSAHQLRFFFSPWTPVYFIITIPENKQASKQASKQTNKQNKTTQHKTKQTNKQTKTHRQTQTNERTKRTNEQPDRHRQTNKQTDEHVLHQREIMPFWNSQS